MRQSKYDQVLQHFKDHEQPESVLIVAGNAALIRIILSWTHVEIKRPKCLKLCTALSATGKWMWLWNNIAYRRDDLLASIPGANAQTEKALDALIASRILYPDGSINSFVQRYLQQRTLQVFGAKRGRPSLGRVQ